GFVEHAARFGEIFICGFPFAILANDILKLALSFGDLAVLGVVVDDGRVRHLRGQVFKFALGLIELLGILHYAITSSPPCLASSAMAPSSAWIATSACESSGCLVVMRWSQRPGTVSIPMSEPWRLAAKRMTS